MFFRDEIYETEEEAVKNLKNLPFGFCPQIKDICRVNCVCYVKSEIFYSENNKKYYHTNSWCKHKNHRK